MQLPAPPTLAELETAETLIKMQSIGTDDLDVNMEIQLQEPTIVNIVRPCELSLEYLPAESVIDTNACYYDAMDKIVDHEDISFNNPENWLKRSDCMDIITGRIHDFVDNVRCQTQYCSKDSQPHLVKLLKITAQRKPQPLPVL